MALLNTNRNFDNIFIRAQEFLVLTACFFYLVLVIHPVLILDALPPVFLSDSKFFSAFLKIPGGITDWLSALFMQFWFSDFLIALFLTCCFWIVAFLTRKWIETQTESRPIHTIHLIPVGLLLVLYSQYYFPINMTFALIFNLTMLNLFIRWGPNAPVLRAIMGFIVSVVLFWITGGAFLIFIVLCGMSELVSRKQIVNGLILLLVLPLLPYVSSATIFLVTLQEAYFHNLLYDSVTNLWLNAYILPVFFLLTLVVLLLTKIRMVRDIYKKLMGFAFMWKLAAGTLLLFGATMLFRQESYNKTAHILLQTNRGVKENNWKAVIDLVPQWTSVNPLFVFQTNLALYKSGLLLDRMFAIPQSLGTVGLLMNFDYCSACSEQTSNFYWMLGMVNESQHWAHEAYEQKGYTPDLLKRLGKIYMLKGYNEAAKKYFLNLKKVPFQEEAAEHLLRLNENPSALAQDPELNTIQSFMPIHDAALTGNPSLIQLQILLDRNPKNEMAFEYLIAFHLLTGNLPELIHHIPDFALFGYKQLPVHVQEAILVIAAQTPNFNKNLLYSTVQRGTYERFMQYQQTFMKYRDDINKAKVELQKQFGDSYWFYFMFVKPMPQRPEGNNVVTR
jgi:hypothetical protein